MDIAEEHLNIPQIISPVDLAVESPDERSVMTYLSFFCRPGSIGQECLLEWIQASLPTETITDFSSDWKDGQALCAMVFAFSPDSLPPADILETQSPVERTELAMSAAEKRLGVKQLLKPEDLVSPDIDQLSVMAYLAQFQVLGMEPQPPSRGSFSNPPDNSYNPPVTSSPPPATSSHTPATFSNPPATFSNPPATFSNPPTTFSTPLSTSSHPPITFSSHAVTNVDTVTEEPKIDESAISELLSNAIADMDNTDFSFLMPNKKQSRPPAKPVDEVAQCFAEQETTVLETAPPPEAYVLDTELDFDLPQEIVVSGRGIARARLDAPAEFVVDCTCVERGRLEVRVTAPGGDTLDVSYRESPDEEEMYQVRFTPKEIGAHLIRVGWNGTPARGSPFTCQASNPDSCIASGAGLREGVLGAKSTFGISTEGAGPGSLSATVYGPGEPVELSMVRSTGDKDSLYTYEYTPHQVGTYVIEIKWDGFAIPGSPFKVVPLTSPPVVPSGKAYVREMPIGRMCVNHPISIVLDTSATGIGKLHAVANGPAVTQEICEIAKVDKATYAVVFYPQDVGEYRIEVSYNDVPIQDGPLDFTVNDPTKCQVDRQAIARSVYQANWPSTFKVATYLAGEGTLTGTVHGPSKNIECSVFEEEEGKHSVTFIPHESGGHTIELLYDGQPVFDAPLSITVGETEETDMGVELSVPEPEESYHLTNRLLEVHMRAPDTNFTSFNITVVGVNKGIVPGKVGMIPTGTDTYTISFRATVADDYKVSVLYNGKRLTGSSLVVPVHSSPSPRDVMTFDPVIPKQVGSPIEVMLDTSQAGLGELSAEVVSSSGKRMDVALTAELANDLYSISFVPKESDVFTAHINWAGQAIRNSPFTINFEVKTSEPTVSVTFEKSHSRSIITALAYGDKCGPVNVKVRQYEKGKYQISFSGAKDTYKLHVRDFNKEIKGSPFSIDLLSPPPAPRHRYIAAITLEQSGVQGVLSACVVGKTTGVTPIELRPSRDGKHVHMSFPDRVRDLYDLYVFWNRQLLKGAPFRLDRSV